MHIANVRLGFANNSSSTHSIVLLPEPLPPDDPPEGHEYGWEWFTLTTPAAKHDYLALTVYENLRDNLSGDMAAAIVRDWCKVDPGEYGHVDHQSVFALPAEWDGRGVNREFLAELEQYLGRPGLVFLGGNDNAAGPHPLQQSGVGKRVNLPLPVDSDRPYVARKDANTGAWTLFNRSTGAKIRFTWDAPEQTVSSKPFAPELVDVKITDYCTEGCPWCYQGSSPTGRHADPDTLHRLASVLGSLHVFEVALGGGEPLAHPDFLAIAQGFRGYGIVPNFTTRRLDWLHDWHVWQPILEACGGFAYSVMRPSDIEDLAALVRVNQIESERVSAQYVMGINSDWQLGSMCEAAARCGIRLTLLGYKATDRGADYKAKNPDASDYAKAFRWLTKAAPRARPALAVDTLLASQWQAGLEGLGVPPLLYDVREGWSSCYVDAVGGYIAPSSFCEPGQRVPLRMGWGEDVEKQVVTAFAGWGSAGCWVT